MNGEFSWERFGTFPVIGILRGFSSDEVESMAESSLRGGLCNLEITMNSEDALQSIRRLQRQFGRELNVGAGTVCTMDDMKRAVDAGAEFIVTPILVAEIVRRCRDEKIPVFPGALTPSEVHQAWQLGADMVKVFPADSLGPSYIRALKGPLPQIRLMPTGGVQLDTIEAYKAAGADAFGVGGPLFPRARVMSKDWQWIEDETRRYRQALG